MRLSFSESDIDPKTQLSPAVNQAAADHIAKQELATGWVDPDKTRVVPASELAAWRSQATPAPSDRSAQAKDSASQADGDGKEPKTFLGLNLPQVIGGVLASTTAAILGGQLGVAGTVVGAAMTTGIITVGGAIYSHGINKTRTKLGAVAGSFRLGGTTPLKNVPDVSADDTGAVDATEQLSGHGREQPGAPAASGQSWRDKISPVKLLATAAAIFILAAVVVTGLEALRGESFSGGGQTTVGQIGEGSSSVSSDSNAGSTEPRREASQPAASPTPAAQTQPPAPTSEATTTTAPNAPTSGSGDTSTGGGSSSGADGTDGAGSDTGTGAQGGSDNTGSGSPQGGAGADPNDGSGQ